jgi:hypothetical protein
MRPLPHAAGGRGTGQTPALNPVPLEYSMEWLTCAIAGRLKVVMAGLAGSTTRARVAALRHVATSRPPRRCDQGQRHDRPPRPPPTLRTRPGWPWRRLAISCRGPLRTRCNGTTEDKAAYAVAGPMCCARGEHAKTAARKRRQGDADADYAGSASSNQTALPWFVRFTPQRWARRLTRISSRPASSVSVTGRSVGR